MYPGFVISDPQINDICGSVLLNECFIGGLGPGGLDSWDPLIYKRIGT